MISSLIHSEKLLFLKNVDVIYWNGKNIVKNVNITSKREGIG